jgi:hypothetical protein
MIHSWRNGWWGCAPAGATHWRSGSDFRRAETRSFAGYCSWGAGPAFGVRRPLRFLAWKLDMSEGQIRQLADVLGRLKTARAQNRVDWERSVGEVADAFPAAAFDTEGVRKALEGRTRSSEALQRELLTALQGIHDVLDEDQRREFAYLLRSGGFAL